MDAFQLRNAGIFDRHRSSRGKRFGPSGDCSGAVLEKKAWALWLMHQYEESAEVCRKVITDMPENMLCLKRLAEFETLLGNTRRAQIYEGRITFLSA
jgi:hypothetical protein